LKDLGGILNKVKLLFDAFQPPEIDIESESLANSICAISGEHITSGIPIVKLVTGATNQPHEIFRVANTQHVSVESARLFKNMRGGGSGGMVGNLLATPAGGDKPMVSRESAIKANRRCWMDILNEIEPGTPTVAIFSTDTKRRLWLLAELSIVGHAWRVYLHEGETSRNLTVDIYRLRKCLALLEQIYSIGFSKIAMRESLYDLAAMRKARISYRDVARLESDLNQWRGTDEFLLSLFVVQKSVQQESTECNPQLSLPKQKFSPQLAGLPLFA
jgi:hypothetical protein